MEAPLEVTVATSRQEWYKTTWPGKGPVVEQETGFSASIGATTWAGDGTSVAWNPVAAEQDCVPGCGVVEVAERGVKAAVDKAPKANDGVGYNAATGSME